MEKSLYDYLNEFGYKEPRIVTMTLKALAYNGVTDIDTLMKMKPEEITRIKGIGPRSMNLITKVTTKEQMRRDQRMAEYKRQCCELQCICLRDWFQKAGLSYLSACQLERILKKNGVNNIDIFMKTTFSEFDKMNGIAEKRLLVISKTKKLIEKEQKAKNYAG